MAEAEPLSPRKTALVLLIVGGCFAVLWPRLLQPALMGRSQHDPLAPNRADRAQGCCDVIFETDVNAIKIMTELCGNILERKSGPLDPRTAAAFASGKLPLDIIATCRREVNATCGVDISSFLQQNVKLGKTYRQILEEVRSYNSSACLKMHFGVPTWQLGTGHLVAKSWSGQEFDNIKQERPPHSRGSAPHPAMRERGRAIPSVPAGDPRPTPPSRGPLPVVTQRAEGRVRSPLSVYYEGPEAEPPPVPGVRPPLGGAGGVLPPPKSSVGFVMPVYTICIVMFFLYTLCKILFKRTDGTNNTYESVTPDPLFRRRVFEDGRSSRSSPETKIVVSAISGLVAEVRQQMDASYAQSHRANSAQDSQEDTTRPYTNGTLRGARDASPVHIVAKEYKDVSFEPPVQTKEEIPELKEVTLEADKTIPELKEALELKEESPEPKEITPVPKEITPQLKDTTPEPKETIPEPNETTPELNITTSELREEIPKIKETTPEPIETTPEPKEITPAANDKISEIEEDNLKLKEKSHKPNEVTPDAENENKPDEKQSTPELLADALKEDGPQKENGLDFEDDREEDKDEKEDGLDEEMSEEEIEYDEEEEEDESPIVRQLRASVEKDKATVKVLGMETTAHCEGGAAWGDRPISPPGRSRAPPAPARPVRQYSYTVHITQTLSDEPSL